MTSNDSLRHLYRVVVVVSLNRFDIAILFIDLLYLHIVIDNIDIAKETSNSTKGL